MIYDIKNQERKINFKNKNYLLEKAELTYIFTSDLVKEYENILSYFRDKIEIVDGDYILPITREEFFGYIGTIKTDSVTSAQHLSKIYNTLFQIIGQNITLSTTDIAVDREGQVYPCKDEVVTYCQILQDKQMAFVVYGTFMGFGANQFDILRKLEWNMINEEEKIVTVDGIEYEVDDYFIKVARDCNSVISYIESDFVPSVEKARGKRKKPREYVLNPESKYILKTRKQKNNNEGLDMVSVVKIRFMLREASQIIFGVPGKMNKTYLHRAGILYRMYLLEKEQGIQWNTYNTYNKELLPFSFNNLDILPLYELNYKNNIED